MVEERRKTIVVLGAGGLLGSEVVRHFSNGPLPAGHYLVKAATRSELDITNGQEVAIWIERLHPDIVINCAALSNVDYCEEHPEEAFHVNAEGVKHISLILEETGGKLVHISTDYVFDGEKEGPYDENDSVNPLSHYAESKLKGEEYVKRFLPEGLIVRVQWLYGKEGRNFSSEIIRQIARGSHPERRGAPRSEGSSYKLIADRIGSPTDVSAVAEGLEALIRHHCSGIYHLSSDGCCSWLEFGKTISELARNQKALQMIEAVRERDIKRPARRPRFSAFSCQKLIADTGYRPLPWKEMLRVFLDKPTSSG